MSNMNTNMTRNRTSWFHSRSMKYKSLCRNISISVLLLLTLTCLFFLFSAHPWCHYNLTRWSKPPHSHFNNSTTPPTNISHIFFGIATSSKTWRFRRPYVESWWRPNVTRGLLFMDKSPVKHLPWPSTLPPFRISQDNSKYHDYNKHAVPFVIRLARVTEEAFNATAVKEEDQRVRWYVIADDDTIVFVENLVKTLSKYDHTKYFYLGMRSESIVSNSFNSFEMGFGGAGYALSYPLAKAVANNMDLCIKRYPTLFGSDHILQSCISDLGVSLTLEKGFHQMDLHRDISGFLSAHPQTPIITLHHLDAVAPIFPSMNHPESFKHLMTAATLDQSRLFQQSVCYYKKNNWTFSVSWGYSIGLYEAILPPSILYRPLETFIPWKKGAWPHYMFNARDPAKNDPPCHASPHLFFFASEDKNRITDHVVTSYVKSTSSHYASPACNRSAQYISEIRVLSPVQNRRWLDGSRRECCDVVQLVGLDSMAIKLRKCSKYEIIA